MHSKIFKNETIKDTGEWFITTIKYEGHGKANFSDPMLTVEGYVSIKFDEFGGQEIFMDVEEVDTSPSSDIPNVPLEFRIPMLMALLIGENPKKRRLDPEKNVAEWSWPIGKKINPCEKLIVVTSDGVFLAEKNIGYNIHSTFNSESGFRLKLDFQISNSFFKIDNSFESKYWVLPLMNFISDFRDNLPELDFHPLRVFDSLINYDLAHINRAVISKYLNQDNQVIIFHFLNMCGFIERLPDYSDRVSRLREGRAQSIITSLMIGETYLKNDSFSDLQNWFPFQFLNLLGLASGTEIGAPWIEFRDARGALVRRFHVNLNSPWFSSGHAAIEESIHHGTGSLLTQSQYSLHMGNAYLTAVLKHLVRSGTKNILFEDGMAHLFQALDCLCEEFGLNIQRLADNLNDCQRYAVKTELTTLAERIRSYVRPEDDLEQRNALIRIADKVKNADNTDRNFGLAVVDLIELFDLYDTIIVDSFFQTNPREDRKPWYGVLSHYRGIVMHSSYFDFERGLHDFQDVARIRSHLHDILIRIVLKMLCYDGTYQAVPGLKGRYELNWVNHNIKADDLGYKETLL